MNKRLEHKIKKIASELSATHNDQNKHFSFIVLRNTIVAIGTNSYTKTHPVALNAYFIYGGIHSEVDAYLKIRWQDINLAKCDLINIRVNRFGEIRMSKPCSKCLDFVRKIGFHRVWYSDSNGIFNKLDQPFAMAS